MFPKPCLVCGQLGDPGQSRCPTHAAEEKKRRETARQPQRKLKALYTTNDYKKRAKAVRDNALICHICKQPAKPNDPWTADHLIPSDRTSPLAPAHRSCNSRRGNKPL